MRWIRGAFSACVMAWCAAPVLAIDKPAGGNPAAAPRPRAEQMEPPAGGDPAARRPDGGTAYLGITTGAVPEELRAQIDLPGDGGLVVTRVLEGSPAAKAGVEPHDILLRFDGREVTSPLGFTEMMEAAEPGKRVRLGIVRRGRQQQISVVLGERPAADGAEDRAADAIGKIPALPGFQAEFQRQAAAAMAQAMAGAGGGSSVQIQTSVVNGDSRSTSISSDAQGTVEIRVQGDTKTVSIRDAGGREVFAGPLTKEGDFKRIPEAWREKVRALDGRSTGAAGQGGRRPPRGAI